MLVTIKMAKQVDLEKYFLLRGIKEINGAKAVVGEEEFLNRPGPEDIAEFILKNGCDFASLVENYRICEDEPFPW